MLFMLVIFLSGSFFGSGGSAEHSMLIENEKNTIKIFKKNVNVVVNVTNIKLARTMWDFEAIEIPAGAGSGFVWDSVGHIVTNFHVVSGGSSFLISFNNDKKQYRADVVGYEPRKDIAVLKLKEKPAKLYAIDIGSSKGLLVGQKAIAIGSPFGMDHTITSGIVSAVGRKIEGIAGIKIHGMIQTDASINPGNSGGPLFDSSGKLIGMNTQILSQSGSSAGIGFAVPVDTIKRIVPQLIKHGKVIQPGLGISIHPHFSVPDGLVVVTVQKGGPADLAGISGIRQDKWGRRILGDVIISISGKPVASYDDYYNALDKYKVGDTVDVSYRRNRKVIKVKVKLTQVFNP